MEQFGATVSDGIEVRTPSEPLTKAARPGQDGEDRWALCDAYRILRDQISRYARGEILGKSILIAGHRGSGKTTLTHLAIQHVCWQAEGKNPGNRDEKNAAEEPLVNAYQAIPFLVPLNGPDLALEQSGGGADGKALALAAMRQIRRALHGALSEEIGVRFSRVCESDPLLREMAYQFRVELDDLPSLALLRSYWDRAGLLNKGLLGKFRGEKARKSQAFKEILAIHTATEALRSGDRAAESAGAPAQAQPAAPTVPSGATLTDGIRNMHPGRVEEAVRVAAPILSLLVGAYSANAVVSSLGPVLAGVIGITAVVMTYSFLSRTLLPKSDDTLRSDPSAGAQALFLPVLVERLFDAGFAPIFLVDELDKVEGDTEAIFQRLMSRLKYVVTGRMLFCILADRSYYEKFREHLRNAREEEAYYSTDKLLICYRHPELRKYLETTYGKPGTDRSEHERIGLTRNLLCSLVLSQSMGHAGKLSSIVKKTAARDGITLGYPKEIWKVSGYRMQILVQLAIEAVFDDQQVQEVLRQEPEFTQRLNDALYLIPSQWRKEAPKLRFHLDPVRDSQGTAPLSDLLQEIASGRADAPGGTNLDYRSLKFLFEQMITLVGYLEVPAKLGLKILESLSHPSAKNAGGPSPDSLAVAAQSLPLLEEIETEGDRNLSRCYNWHFDQFGQQCRDEVAPPPGAAAWQKGVEHDDGKSIGTARFALLSDLEAFLASDLKAPSGDGRPEDFADLMDAVDRFPDYSEPKIWEGLRTCLFDTTAGFLAARTWASWIPRQNFETLVEELRKAADSETFLNARKLLLLECAIHAEWRVHIFPILAMARRKGRRLVEVAQNYRSNLDLDWLALQTGIRPQNMLDFLSRGSRFSAGSLQALRAEVKPEQNP